MRGRDEAQHAVADAIVDGAPVLIIIVDAVGTIMFCNDACEWMVGFTADELVGNNMLDYVDTEWSQLAMVSIGSAFEASGLRLPMRFKIRRKDDSYMVAEVTANTQLDDPDVQGMIVYIREWDEQQALDDILRSIAGDESLAEKLKLFVDLMAAPPLAADSAVLYAPDDDRFAKVVSHEALDPALLADDPAAPWHRVLVTGQEQLIAVPALPDSMRSTAEALGYRWCWCCPVRAADDTIRASLLLWRRDERPMEEYFRASIDRVTQFTKVVLEQEDNRSRLLYAAGHDPLTGLANRATFFGRFQDLLDDPAGSTDRYVGVLYLDLDGFKPVNDTLGHGAGDAVLVAIAHRLTSRVRTDDLVARMGGDEFAVVCPAVASPEELEALAARLADAAREPVRVGDHVVEVSASVGAGLARVGTCSIDALIDAADGAMYTAKTQRPGSVQLVAVTG